MNPSHRSLVAVAAAVCVSACATSGGASPPRLDHEQGAAAPVFQPMLVVPLPPLQPAADAGHAMEALQARNTPLGDVLLALFKDSDINLVIDPSVQATACTFDIKRSTVEDAFEAVLDSLDLAYRWDGSFLRVTDTVEDTIAVDLMAANATSGGSGSGSSGSGSSGSGNSGGGTSDGNVWDDLENALPKLLGEVGTSVVNKSASAIHVQARPSAVRRVRELIGTTLRRANKQVSLEARVLEVRLNDKYNLGVDWSLLPGFFSTSKTGTLTDGAMVHTAAKSAGTAFQFGLLKSGDFSLFVDALQEQGQVRVLSSPRVSTLNNQPASITVTDQIPYITREVITENGSTRTEFGVAFVDAGVLLNVRPLIGDDGLLSVSVTPSVREQIGTVVTPDGLVTVPVISEREATTSVRVADGQAIAIGGLRTTRKTETRSGIPFLMNVPWFGQLFSSTVDERDEVELMIVLVPRVLDDTWIGEEIERGAHRLVQLRRGFQWNAIDMEGLRLEDWSGGSLQGHAQAIKDSAARLPDRLPAPMAADRGTTVTRRGLAAHLLARADAALADGDTRLALDEIEQALLLEPTCGEALVTAGVLGDRRGDRQRARMLLDRALQQRPDDVIALTARGAFEMANGSAHAARRLFTRAHELGKTSLTASNLAAALLALGEHAAAASLLRTVVGPAAPAELHANLAFAELAGGNVDGARASYRDALTAGGEARNPRLVALDRLIGVEEERRAVALKVVVQRGEDGL